MGDVQKVKVKGVGVVSSGLVLGLMMAITTLFVFVLFSPIMYIVDSSFGMLGVGMLLLMIPIYFIMGFIMGCISALIYNHIIVKITSGLKFSFEKEN